MTATTNTAAGDTRKIDHSIDLAVAALDDRCVLDITPTIVNADDLFGRLTTVQILDQVKRGFARYTRVEIYLRELLEMAAKTMPSSTDAFAAEAAIEGARALLDDSSALLIGMQDATLYLVARQDSVPTA